MTVIYTRTSDTYRTLLMEEGTTRLVTSVCPSQADKNLKPDSFAHQEVFFKRSCIQWIRKAFGWCNKCLLFDTGISNYLLGSGMHGMFFPHWFNG
jgi:hypothetical protein